MLLEHKIAVDEATNQGETALHLSAEKGHTEFVKLLLDRNADISVANKGGFSAYELARRGGHKEIASMVKPPAKGGCCSVM